MASLSILPPLAISLPHIPPATEETAASDSQQPSSPCGSIRIHRLASGIPQENVDVCAADQSSASVDTAAQRNDHLHSPLQYVSTASLPTLKTSLDGSNLRRIPSDPAESVFCNRPSDDICTVWPVSGRGVIGSRTTGLGADATKAPTSDAEPNTVQPKRPFRKWVQTFSRRRTERQQEHHLDLGDAEDAAVLPTPRTIGDSSYSRNSSSVSSFAYVTGVRDASVSVFGQGSIVPSSRRQTARSSKGLSRTDRSSRFSISARQSDDDTANEKQQLQAEAHIVARSIQRRRILEELIETEEGYIGDIKFLMNAYMTIFASSPSADSRLRLSMYSNLTDIVELHDQILGELHQAIPDSEYSHLSFPRAMAPQRRSYLGAVSEDRPQRQHNKDVAEMMAAPDTAAKAASVFSKVMDRFYIYEEYRAKLDMVLDDLKLTYRSIPNWDDHQKGLEALASCLSYARDWQDSKRALSIDDLLAKPIQRACRYPLLFRELLKSTPVCDCPRAHSDIENVLERLHEVTVAMNKATQDPFFKAHLEKTWILQERLRFPAHARDGATKSQIRLFGRVHLCGVLHVCWQSAAMVRGSYMICLLFRSWLCLAVADTTGKAYELQACLALKKCSLEQDNNGKGLQCHSAPFSWKVAFENNGQMYEVLMTASTAKEEDEWRRRILDGCVRDGDAQRDHATFTFVGLDLQALGTAPKTKQKHSLRRATTAPSKVQLVQVLLKNTSSETEDAQPLGRSHSVPRTACIPVPTPSRGDRARLEAAIADVWTRDALMSSTGSRERLMRPSASAMMRRINVLSRTGTFGRRSPPRSPSTPDVAELFPKRPPPPRRPLSDRRIRLSLGHGRLRHHDRSVANQEETTKVGKVGKAGKTGKAGKAGKAEAVQRLDTTKCSSSSGDEDGKMYAVTGTPAQLQLFGRESTTPRRQPGIQFIKELDEGYRLEPATTMPSLRCPAVAPTPRSSGHAASSSLTSVTGSLLAVSTTYDMMAPLTRHGSRGTIEGRDGPEAKTARRWLKRPSLHRTLRKMQH